MQREDVLIACQVLLIFPEIKEANSLHLLSAFGSLGGSEEIADNSSVKLSIKTEEYFGNL